MRKGKIIGLSILGIIIVAAAAGGLYLWQSYTGESYYTQINKEGRAEDVFDSKGNNQGKNYTYQLEAYNEDGKEKEVEFHTLGDQPLRQNAFLLIKVNDKKGVLSYEEVTEKEVPEKALSKLK